MKKIKVMSDEEITEKRLENLEDFQERAIRYITALERRIKQLEKKDCIGTTTLSPTPNPYNKPYTGTFSNNPVRYITALERRIKQLVDNNLLNE